MTLNRVKISLFNINFVIFSKKLRLFEIISIDTEKDDLVYEDCFMDWTIQTQTIKYNSNNLKDQTIYKL